MKIPELLALTEWAHASRELLNAYAAASEGGMDPAKWDAFSAARERSSAAGHVLYRYAAKIRIGEPV